MPQARTPRSNSRSSVFIDGGPLCKKGEAEKVSSPLFPKQGNAANLLDEIRGQGIALHI